MKQLLNDVAAFHKACDVPILIKPAIPARERQNLRLELIREEVDELELAIGLEQLHHIADALGDIIYVVVGTALEFGIPLDKVWDEIQRSNMAKVNPVTGKVRKREDGKVLKPDGWTPPDIARVIGEAAE